MGSNSVFRQFPGFDAVFELSEPGAVRFFRASLKLSEDAFKVTRGEVTPKQPVRAHWMMGGKTPGDVIWTGHVASVLISDRIFSLLRKSGFTGWSTYQVELYAKNGKEIPGYYGLVVHGRCGPLDNTKCVQVPKKFPAKVSMVWKGLYFQPATWDGSDLFMPQGKGGWIFVTGAIKEVFERAKIQNLVFTPLSGVLRDIL